MGGLSKGINVLPDPILITVGITIRRVSHTFLVLPHFLLLFLELRKPFRQIRYLIGVSGTRFLPGILSGPERLGRLVLGTTIFQKPATLLSIVGCE